MLEVLIYSHVRCEMILYSVLYELQKIFSKIFHTAYCILVVYGKTVTRSRTFMFMRTKEYFQSTFVEML